MCFLRYFLEFDTYKIKIHSIIMTGMEADPMATETTAATLNAKADELEQQLLRISQESRNATDAAQRLLEEHAALNEQLATCRQMILELRRTAAGLLKKEGAPTGSIYVAQPDSQARDILQSKLCTAKYGKPGHELLDTSILDVIENTHYRGLIRTKELARPALCTFAMLLEHEGTVSFRSVLERTRYEEQTLQTNITGPLAEALERADYDLVYQQSLPDIRLERLSCKELVIEDSEIAEIMDKLILDRWKLLKQNPVLPEGMRPHEYIGTLMRKGMLYLIEQKKSGKESVSIGDLCKSVRDFVPKMRMSGKDLARLLDHIFPHTGEWAINADSRSWQIFFES